MFPIICLRILLFFLCAKKMCKFSFWRYLQMRLYRLWKCSDWRNGYETAVWRRWRRIGNSDSRWCHGYNRWNHIFRQKQYVGQYDGTNLGFARKSVFCPCWKILQRCLISKNNWKATLWKQPHGKIIVGLFFSVTENECIFTCHYRSNCL